MTSIDILENKISGVKKYLKILENYQAYSQKELESDLNLKGALERYLYLAVQSTIDLAESLVSYKKLRKPSTFAEAFIILKEDDFLPQELLEEMIKMTGFRNIITHDYAEVDFTIVYQVLKKGLKDIQAFVNLAEKIS